MYLSRLSLVNFKNYAQAELVFSAEINGFTGMNGEGKTNLLDAIHYLSFCKSFLNPIDSQNIRHDEGFFVIEGTFVDGDAEDTVYCGIKRSEKKQFKRNKKTYDRLADHIGRYPLVIISPADTALVTEGSEVRRKFVDSVIAQYNKPYLDHLIQYNKALAQRNALLKKFFKTRRFDEVSLEVWDVQLVEKGTAIHSERKKFIADFIPQFNEYFQRISQGKEEVDLYYHSHLHESDFAERLMQARERDRIVQHTTVGIHKDNLEFTLGGRPIKKFGSQGQQKSYLTALKLAQFDFIKEIKKVTPLLLLDDIFDKLDSERVQAILQLVSEHHFGQIFITDTNPERIAEIMNGIDADHRIFHIKDGEAVVQETSEHA